MERSLYKKLDISSWYWGCFSKCVNNKKKSRRKMKWYIKKQLRKKIDSFYKEFVDEV